jgi:hypothetical protein
MVMLFLAFSIASAWMVNTVRVIEAQQPLAIRGVQGEGIPQTMRTLRRRRSAFDLEL